MYVLLYVLVSLTILSVDWLRICQNTCWRNVIVAKWNSLMGVLSFSFFYSLQEGFSKIVKLLCELSVLCLILKLDETVFPNGSGLIQHDNVPCHTTTIVQKWFEEHNSSMCWLGLQTHISIQMSMCRMYWKQVWSMEGPPRNLQDWGSAANILVPNTTAHIQTSCGVHASTGQSCFACERGTYIILGN